MAQRRLSTTRDRERIRKAASRNQRHKGKRPGQITDAEVIAWAREKMLEELKLSS